MEEGKETVLLAWRALEYEDYIRSWKYYLLFALTFILIAAYSIWQQDWFVLGVFVVLAGFMIWYQLQKPKEKIYRISQLGIYEDEKFYPFNEIFSYWFSLSERHKTLYIQFTKKYIPPMAIQIPSVDPIKLREILSKKIPEETTKTESFIDRMMRLLKL